MGRGHGGGPGGGPGAGPGRPRRAPAAELWTPQVGAGLGSSLLPGLRDPLPLPRSQASEPEGPGGAPQVPAPREPGSPRIRFPRVWVLASPGVRRSGGGDRLLQRRPARTGRTLAGSRRGTSCGTMRKPDGKIVLLGDMNVGKTSLLHRYMERRFPDTVSTVGGAFYLKQWRSYNISIWDTAGTGQVTLQREKFLVSMYPWPLGSGSPMLMDGISFVTPSHLEG
ncbi:ras-related protein Rab-20 isoform X6 [Mustela erminea]|uniref:ras-related protein Rab-20 isoform X6 n=1 Tax=Mustela erminea TaxID=36723 RepID=UPI001386737A|nr:ras-related protein Rab-20 isoform X6 [Mustela erminea]